ncbi:hypothetical protein KUW17_12410 [Leisingera aquaemixtae]|uniref:hypothetical protein n=1 Tax=Leisingera TaxID=191028 RepID=UPI001C97A3B9|nr:MULTISPECIES: hypothetical protein [Leisingera]MBY6067550.1 hypothetical protein [Leisingera aquaemixtae]MCB4454701.1 hypothetical protein [Leisingera sp. McT4-56]
MRNMIFALLGLMVLSACGADGEPVQPTLNAGVGVGSGGGVHVGGAVGLHKGPLSVFLGF